MERCGTRCFLAAIAAVCILAPMSHGQPDWLNEVVAGGTNVTVDEEAPAVVLYESVDIVIRDDGSAKGVVRRAVKLLSNQAIEQTFFSETIRPGRKVDNLKGWRIEPSGKTHELKKEMIVEVGLQQTSGYYSDYKTMAAGFADVSRGDIVGWEYETKEDKGIEGLFQGCVFQVDLPVVASRYVVEVPDGWELHSSGRHIDDVASRQEGNRYTWECGFLSYRPDEPFMPPWGYLSRTLLVSCHNPADSGTRQFSDWKSVAKWTWGLHCDATKPNDSLSELVAQLTAGMTSKTAKVQAIARFAQDHIRYVAVELGEGRFQPRDAVSTLYNRYGDCKDKTTLMRAMLAEAGIASFPVLACVDGYVDPDFPTPFQFDHVIVGIPLSELDVDSTLEQACSDDWFFFDPTDESTPVGCLPATLYHTKVLRITPDDTALIRLPDLLPEQKHRVYAADVSVDLGGNIEADVRISDYHTSAASSHHWRRRTEIADQIDEYMELFAESMRQPQITDYAFGGDGDSAWATFHLTGRGLITESGNLSLLKANIFYPDQQASLNDKSGRVHDIWFGNARLREAVVDWHLPSGWRLSGGADSVTTECEVATVTARTLPVDGGVHFEYIERLEGGLIDVADYKAARTFDRKRASLRSTKLFLESE